MAGVAPMALNIRAVRKPPPKVAAMIFQLAMPVQRRISAPMAMAMIEVSPIDPGISPEIMSHEVRG